MVAAVVASTDGRVVSLAMGVEGGRGFVYLCLVGAAVGLVAAFVLIWMERRRHPLQDAERRRMQLSLCNAAYQNLLGTSVVVFCLVGIILDGIGPAAWPVVLLGGLLGLRSTLAPSSYPSYLGMGHISVRMREEEFQYEERLSAELQRLQDPRLIAGAMLPYFLGIAVYLLVAQPALSLPSWLELGVSALVGWLFIRCQASAVQYLQVLRALYRVWDNEDRGLR